MMFKLPPPAERPTLYFIGVTTSQSSIMQLFPQWAAVLGLGDACIKGIDLAIHAPAEDYRRCVEFIRDDPGSLGALVTTHKIDLYHAAHDLFDDLDPYARLFGELSSISKVKGRLCGHAKDPISSGLALDSFIPAGHWQKTAGQVVILGAGGSALAISAYLAQEQFGANRPARIHLTNRSAPRLAEAERILAGLLVPMSFHLCPEAWQNDAIINQVPADSLIVNATGLGKDRPGSPVTDDLEFPVRALIWELNYRGSLEFLHQARQQEKRQQLLIEDGWIYFIHGWTQVIAEVFQIVITPGLFSQCSELAMALRHGGTKNV